jgi:hypothetical protein
MEGITNTDMISSWACDWFAEHALEHDFLANTAKRSLMKLNERYPIDKHLWPWIDKELLVDLLEPANNIKVTAIDTNRPAAIGVVNAASIPAAVVAAGVANAPAIQPVTIPGGIDVN